MKKKLLFTLFTTLVLVVLLLTGCNQNKTTDIDKEKIQVMTSILPVAEFITKVGGDKVEVEALIPPGYEPHSYELTPEQLKKVSDADLFVKTGQIEFERANMDKIIEQNKGMKVIDGAEGITLRDMEAHDHEVEHEADEQENKDPHTWLAVGSAKIYINNIYQALVELDADNENYYKSNKQAYEKELDEVDEYLKDTLGKVENKKLIVYHPAFGYLLDEYGFVQMPIEIEGKEPTAAQLEELIEHAREYGIRVVFVQEQFSPKNAEVIAAEINGTVVEIDPLASDFIANLKRIADKINQNN